MQINMQENMQNMQAICRFCWYGSTLHAICKICKIICTICKICKRHFQYAEYAPPTLLMLPLTPSESPRKNSFVETLALTPPLSPGPGQAAYEHCEQTWPERRGQAGTLAAWAWQSAARCCSIARAGTQSSGRLWLRLGLGCNRCDVGAPTGVYWIS